MPTESADVVRLWIPTQRQEELRLHREEIAALTTTWVWLPVACTSKHGFPHIHNVRDRHSAVKQWNRDSSQQACIDLRRNM